MTSDTQIFTEANHILRQQKSKSQEQRQQHHTTTTTTTYTTYTRSDRTMSATMNSNSNSSSTSSNNRTRTDSSTGATASPKRRSSQIWSSVRFCERVLVQETIHMDNLSHAEIRAMWYSSADFCQIKQRERKLSKKAGEMGSENDRNAMLHLHGIESSAVKRKAEQRVQTYTVSILQEQEWQWTYSKIDPILISSLSQFISKESRMAARERGSRLATHVKKLRIKELDLQLMSESTSRDQESQSQSTSTPAMTATKPSSFSSSCHPTTPKKILPVALTAMRSPCHRRWAITSHPRGVVLDSSLMIPQR